MQSTPSTPQIYHITHKENLAGILKAGAIYSDKLRIQLNLGCEVIGKPEIKGQRLRDVNVPCHSDTRVGDYVPFYFAPRSIMLFMLHKRNNPGLLYRGGQEPIVHLRADFQKTVAWAHSSSRLWAFTDGNAAARLTNFYDDTSDLGKLDWPAIEARIWNASPTKEKKQAEFLLFELFPFQRIEEIGVHDAAVAAEVHRTIEGAIHKPIVSIRPEWYY